MYELPQELLNNVRLKILENYEISIKSPKFLHLMTSTQPSSQKPNFDVFWYAKLIFENAHSLYKFTFKATQLQKIPEYDIFQKTLFCILASSMNLELNAVPVAAEQYL